MVGGEKWSGVIVGDRVVDEDSTIDMDKVNGLMNGKTLIGVEIVPSIDGGVKRNFCLTMDCCCSIDGSKSNDLR